MTLGARDGLSLPPPLFTPPNQPPCPARLRRSRPTSWRPQVTVQPIKVAATGCDSLYRALRTALVESEGRPTAASRLPASLRSTHLPGSRKTAAAEGLPADGGQEQEGHAEGEEAGAPAAGKAKIRIRDKKQLQVWERMLIATARVGPLRAGHKMTQAW